MEFKAEDLSLVAQALLAVADMAGKDVADMQANLSQAALSQAYFKRPGQLVTAADKRSHAIMRAELSRRFPHVPLILEEQDNPDVLPSEYITGDELDGTVVYASGLDEWGISLAYVKGGRPVAGVLVQPARNLRLITWHQGGTWAGERRLTIAPASTLSDVIVHLQLNQQVFGMDLVWVRRLATEALAARALATAVGGAVEVLLGQAGVYLNSGGGSVWDFAAAALAVEEAGGVACDEQGLPLDWSRLRLGVLLAQNAGLLQQVLALRGP